MNEPRFEAVYGQKCIMQHQQFVRIVPSPEPPRWQRFKWFCSRNRYVPLYIVGAVLLGAYMPIALVAFVVSFVMSFLLVSVIGLIIR